MSKEICIHCYISGKVQGVWFRASAKIQADLLCITGWAHNLADGRVEVLACGEQENINQFYAWLKYGPPLAQVIEITYEEIALQKIIGFTTN
jgi:acylphosphatase